MIDTKRLRQKILDLAVRGKLVPQDPNDEPASVLLERVRAEKQRMVAEGRLKRRDVAKDSVIFIGDDSCHYEKVGDAEPVCVEAELPFELPQGWEWARLGSVSDEPRYGTSRKSDPVGAIPVLRMGNITRTGTIDYADLVYTSNPEDISKFALKAGDILFNRTNSREWVGKTAYYDGHMPAIYAGYLVRFTPFLILGEFVNYAMCAPYEREWCSSVKTDGVNQSNINVQKLKQFLLPVPPLAEQRRIVSALDELLGLVDEVERSQADLTALLDRARAKVLDLAIRGRLVPQDPNDEPASVLLARVREERRAMVAGGRLRPRDVEGDSAIFRGEDNSYYERLEDGRVFAIEDELPSIPTSWAWSRLSSVVTSCGGKTPSMSNNTFWEEGTVPWVTSKDMKTEELSDSAMHISEAASHTMRLIPPESVLVVVRSGILKRTLPVSLNRMTTTINQDLKALIPSSVLSADYLALAIRANDAAIRSRYHKDGTTVDSIDFDRMLGMLIPIPPLSEQRRIASVAKHYSKSIFGCIA